MLELIREFTLIGAMTFGGGSAATPIIHSRLVYEKKWLTEDEFIDIVAMANVLPGPSMIQMAAIIGLRRTNYLGAIISSLMISAPSIIVFVIVMNLFTKYIDPVLMGQITAPIFIVIALSMAMTSLKIMENARQNSNQFIQLLLFLGTLSLIIIANIPTIWIIVTVIIASIMKVGILRDH